MRYALLILEQPWFRIPQDPRQSSVRPFLEGLAALNDMPLFHASYYDRQSFDKALSYLLEARELESVDKLILYVGAHATGGRLGGDFGQAMNLDTLFRRLTELGHKQIAGLILDSCELGAKEEQLAAGVKQAGLSWLIAHAARIDWMDGMLTNLNLLHHLCQIHPDDLDKRDSLLTRVQAATSLFNPFHIVEEDDYDDDEILQMIAEAEDAADEEDEEAEEPEDDEDADEPDDEDDEDSEDGDEEDDDEDLSLSLQDSLTVILRYRLSKKHSRVEILTAGDCWPGLDDSEDEDDE